MMLMNNSARPYPGQYTRDDNRLPQMQIPPCVESMPLHTTRNVGCCFTLHCQRHTPQQQLCPFAQGTSTGCCVSPCLGTTAQDQDNAWWREQAFHTTAAAHMHNSCADSAAASSMHMPWSPLLQVNSWCRAHSAVCCAVLHAWWTHKSENYGDGGWCTHGARNEGQDVKLVDINPSRLVPPLHVPQHTACEARALSSTNARIRLSISMTWQAHPGTPLHYRSTRHKNCQTIKAAHQPYPPACIPERCEGIKNRMLHTPNQ